MGILFASSGGAVTLKGNTEPPAKPKPVPSAKPVAKIEVK